VLRKQIDVLDRLAGVAEAEGRLSEFSTISRTMQTALALSAKLEPPPRHDPEADPDMQAIAKAARAKLHELLDRALEGDLR
jgi:hypothetical protein